MLRKHSFIDIFAFSLFLYAYAAESVENDIRGELLELTKRMKAMELRDNEHLAEIKSLKSEVLAYKQQTEDLRHLVERLTGEPERNDKKEDILDVEGVATDAQSIKRAENIIYERQIADKRIRRHENEMNIAFFATLSKHLLHTGVKQNIVFDHVITNDGSAYSNTLGAFVAPVDGTYVFSASVMAIGAQAEHYWLARNGGMVSQMYVGAVDAPYITTGITAVLNLNAGDNVEIKTIDGDGSAHGYDYSSFSGFLLHQSDSTVLVGK